MKPTYYVIELSPRWLTALLVLLAVVMVLAFAFGYGAAWSVMTARDTPPPMAGLAASATPTGAPAMTPTRRASATRVPPTATRVSTATATAAAPTPVPPTPTPRRRATVAPPTPVASRSGDVFWVQVLATSRRAAISEARQRLEQLGFPREHQRVETADVAGGGVLHKVRIGPFPDRESADRVVRRMEAADFPDAWVIVP